MNVWSDMSLEKFLCVFKPGNMITLMKAILNVEILCYVLWVHDWKKKYDNKIGMLWMLLCYVQ